jgi:GntR family transcriptional regulator, transcriptional repressor for pyruvate dehydrogenase complex
MNVIDYERIVPRPAYKVVSDAIEAKIAAGELKVGDRLPTEADLSSVLGVNRSTVREGIRLLEESGIVERRAGRRLFVVVPNTFDLAERTSLALQLARISFRELWEVMMVVEPLAAEMAAERASDNDFRRMRAVVDATEAAAAVSPKSVLPNLDNEFHALVSEAAGNRFLELHRGTINTLLRRANEVMMPLVPQSGRRLAIAHREILSSLEMRNSKRAAEWMRRHVADFKRGYELAGLGVNDPVPINTRGQVQT